MQRGWFLGVFAASGAAALVYEVAWTRLLTLQLGHSVAAASTVLAAYMGGMAVGAALGGRIGDRVGPARALGVYAALEAAIAVLALLLPLELAAFTPLFVGAYADGAGGAGFSTLRLIATLLLLSIPAAAMGATFPVASRWFVRRADRAAVEAGGLYAANTVGAALGAVLAGFVLIPALGLRGTTGVGALLNFTAAGLAVWLSRRPAADAASAAAGRTADRGRSGAPGRTRGAARAAAPAAAAVAPYEPSPHAPLLAALALGASGFASLTLQVIWTRLLALILGPTTYAFSAIVAVFIAGLAMGSAAGTRLAARARQPMAGLIVSLFAAVALALLAAGLIDRSLLSLAEVVARPDSTFAVVLRRQVLIAAVLLLPMTFAFGVAFPFAAAVATRRDETIARDLALIYTVNTLGAIAGALAAGFALIPWLGLHGSIRLVAAAATVAGLALLAASGVRGRARIAAGLVAVAAAAAAIWMPAWNPLLLSSGAYKYASRIEGPDLQTALTAGTLDYYKEGASSTVAVRSLIGTRSLAIDGKVDASNGGDMLTQRLLAHVPLLLHPDPRRVAILGMGSGVTAGSALTHGIESATILEISPEVIEASAFFTAENHDVLHDPRVRVIVGDGRTHLLLTRQQYDVIVSEPSNPWMAGIASLFTREFFAAAKARLAPGGILCQWAHTYDITEADLKSIVATFLTVFPDGTLWLVGDGDVLLVASNGPVLPRLDGVATAWTRPGVAADLAGIAVRSPSAVLSMFVADGPTAARWVAGAPLQTDDRASLEFSGPRNIFGRGRDDNAQTLRALAAASPRPPAIAAAERTATAAEWRDQGLMLLTADSYRPAYERFVRALALDPDDGPALDGLLRAATPIQRQEDAQTLLSGIAADPARIPAQLALSRLLASRGIYAEAVRLPLDVLRRQPADVAALEQLASVLSDAGDADRLAPVVASLQQHAPDSDAAHYYQGALHFLQDHPERAVADVSYVIARNPRNARAQNLLGACLASLGRRDEARRAFQASIAANPRDPATYANLGTLELQAGNKQLAVQHFAEALTVDPGSQPARQGLVSARADAPWPR